MKKLIILAILLLSSCINAKKQFGFDSHDAKQKRKEARREAKQLQKDSTVLSDIIARRPGWQSVNVVVIRDTVYVPQTKYEFRLVSVKEKAVDDKKVDSLFSAIENKLEDIMSTTNMGSEVSSVKHEIKQMLADRPLIRDTTITQNGVTFRAYWKDEALHIDLVTPEKKIAYDKTITNRTIQPPPPQAPAHKQSWFWWLLLVIAALTFLLYKIITRIYEQA